MVLIFDFEWKFLVPCPRHESNSQIRKKLKYPIPLAKACVWKTRSVKRGIHLESFGLIEIDISEYTVSSVVKAAPKILYDL